MVIAYLYEETMKGIFAIFHSNASPQIIEYLYTVVPDGKILLICLPNIHLKLA